MLESARQYVGYTARAGRSNEFGTTTGYPDVYWGGSLLDVLAYRSGVWLPAHIHPASALAWYQGHGRMRNRPKPGDIVFYATPAGGESAWAVMHVGLVTETGEWRTHARFKAIDGQSPTGLPRGSQEPNGVYQRTHYSTDVIGFARPRYTPLTTSGTYTPADGLPVVRPTHFQLGKSHRSVELVQEAIARQVPLRQAKRGLFDAQTRSAYAAYQRLIGHVGIDASGQPDINSLSRLAHDSEYPFTAGV